MVKFLRQVDQWLVIGQELWLSPTDIDADGARLIARGRTMGGPEDGEPFEKAIELAVGAAVHFGPHVAVTLLEVRSAAGKKGPSVRLGVLAPANVPVQTKEQLGQFDPRRGNDGK